MKDVEACQGQSISHVEEKPVEGSKVKAAKKLSNVTIKQAKSMYAIFRFAILSKFSIFLYSLLYSSKLEVLRIFNQSFSLIRLVFSKFASVHHLEML